MFGDIQELLVIFIIALLVVGPKKLPEVAKAAGKILGELKRALTEVRFELDQEMNAQSRVGQARKEEEQAGREMETKEKEQAGPEYESAGDGPGKDALEHEGAESGTESAGQTSAAQEHKA